MALLTCTFKSSVLHSDSTYLAVIPDKVTEDIPVVYLLHGFSGDQSSWVRNSRCGRYANDRSIALIMPDAGNSFYTDMAYGEASYTYITEEVFAHSHKLFRLSEKREATFTAGLSMGGYGAFKIALRNPKVYSAACSMSGCLCAHKYVCDPDRAELTRLIYGPGVTAAPDHDNLFFLADKLLKSDLPRPRLLQLCGTEDYLYGQNKEFREYIKDKGFDYSYDECPGEHEWRLWDAWLPRALDFFLGR